MAFSSRAKKYRQDDGSGSSATGSAGGSQSFEDLRQIEQQDALKRMARTLKPLRTQLQSIASKVRLKIGLSSTNHFTCELGLLPHYSP